MIETILHQPVPATTAQPGEPQSHHTGANQDDVNYFNSALNDSQNATWQNNQAISEQKSASPVSHLASLEADAMAKLQQLSTSLNPGDYMKTARSLSAYQLETMVTTKVIAKSTQALEKLTNLQ